MASIQLQRPGLVISMYESREAEIRSLLEMIESRAVLERVVDKLVPQRFWDLNSARNPREKAIAHLKEAVSIDRGTKSSVISLSIKESSPAQAQMLLTVFLEQFRELHMDANSTEGSYEFFVDQSELVEAEYEAANKKLQDAKNALGVSSLADKRKVLEAKETELRKIARSQKPHWPKSKQRSKGISRR
ncbi:MAG: hypothetical protein R3C11_19455 [Planctomycetaceae bacterium]